MLTARTLEKDKMLGFKLGVDDYQLHYALQTIKRLGPNGITVAMSDAAKKASEKKSTTIARK